MLSRPAWATTIGILLILFGGCSTVNHIKLTRTDDIETLKSSFLNEIDVQIKTEDLDPFERELLLGSSDSLNNDSIPKTVDVKSAIERLTFMTDYFKKWCSITGYIGIVISLLFIISGILLFYKKKFTIPLTFVALISSIIFAIAKIIIFKDDTSSEYLLTGMSVTFYMSIFLDLVILVILSISDKSYYNEFGYVEG